MRLPGLLLLLISLSCAAKIAIFVFPLSNSHVMFTINVAEELARDHDVVIIRPNANPAASKLVSKHPRVREIRTNGVQPDTIAEYKRLESDILWTEVPFSHWFSVAHAFKAMVQDLCTDFVNDPHFMEQLKAEKIDLAITHHLDCCPVSVIHAAGIPQFGHILSTPLIKTFLNYQNIPVFPSFYPSHLVDATNEMTNWQRFKNFAFELLMGSVGVYFQGKTVDNIFREKYGPEFPAYSDLAYQSKFLLANVHPDIEYPIPVTSKVTYFGGLGMTNETKPLEEPYLSFVGKAKKVVFVSFGTVADPKIMPLSWKQSFVELFEKNPEISFIWRMTDDVVVPKNVLRSMWHPQKDILGHPKVAAFITHAGYNSLGESIASGTPLITVPLFGDQFRNAGLAEFRGFGVRLAKTEMNADALNDALHKVLNNPSYEKAAQSLRKIVFSSPISAGDSLRHAVNFVLDNPDYNRDIPALPFWKFFSLDMIFLVFVFPLCIPMLLKWYFWSCCKMAYKEKEKMN